MNHLHGGEPLTGRTLPAAHGRRNPCPPESLTGANGCHGRTVAGIIGSGRHTVATACRNFRTADRRERLRGVPAARTLPAFADIGRNPAARRSGGADGRRIDWRTVAAFRRSMVATSEPLTGRTLPARSNGCAACRNPCPLTLAGTGGRFQTALNGLASARRGGTGANPSGTGGRNGGRLRRVSGDGGGAACRNFRTADRPDAGRGARSNR